MYCTLTDGKGVYITPFSVLHTGKAVESRELTRAIPQLVKGPKTF